MRTRSMRKPATTRRRWTGLLATLGMTGAIVAGGALPAAAAAPPAGVYEGTAVQIIGGDNELEEPFIFDLTLEIDTSGRLTAFETEYWWVCASVGQHGFSPFEPATGVRVTAGAPFATDTAHDHRVEGIVAANGTASGTGFAHVAFCGGAAFTWTAELASRTNIPHDDGSSTAGIDDGGIGGTGNQYFLNDSFGPTANRVFNYANRGGRVYVGDWDGNGTDTLAYRIGNTFYVRNSNNAGGAHQIFSYGRPGDRVYVGDWNGDGKDTFAVRRGSVYHVKNTLRGGDADQVINYGRQGDDVLIGDWAGDGRDTLAVRRGSVYHVKNRIAGGEADRVVNYGRPDDDVYVGDWNGNGRDSFAVRRGKTYHIAYAIRGGAADRVLNYGRDTDTTLVGDWNGDRTDTLGVRR